MGLSPLDRDRGWSRLRIMLEQSEKVERLWVLVTFLARDPSTMTGLQQEVQIGQGETSHDLKVV